MRILLAPAALAAGLLCFSLSASAATLNVGVGSTFDAGTGTLAMNCGDVSVAGNLRGGSALFEDSRDFTIQPGGLVNGQSATFEIMGDWTNGGLFTPDTSTVNFLDGCLRTSATISGDTTFYEMNLVTTSGKTYFFEAGSAQIVLNFLRVIGAPGNLLTIRSTSAGVAALIDLVGDQLVNYVDVQDNHAIGEIIGPAPPDVFNSIKGTNSNGWFVRIVIPTLSVWGMLVFVLLMLGVTWRRLRPAQIRMNRNY